MIRNIRLVEAGDIAEWRRLRLALWPAYPPEQIDQEICAIRTQLDRTPVFVAERLQGGLGGMIEVALRATADGCITSPVGYIEGWIVEPDLREQGIGRRLVETAEAWARHMGCQEMGSDTTPKYPLSPPAHAHLGYMETSTPLHYRKLL